MHLIFDTVNDVSRFKGLNAARPRFLLYHDVTGKSLKSRPLALSSSSSLLAFYYHRFNPSKRQKQHVMTLSVCKNVRILISEATGSAINVLRAPGSTVG